MFEFVGIAELIPDRYDTVLQDFGISIVKLGDLKSFLSNFS